MIFCECNRESRDHSGVCGQPATMLCTREGIDVNLCPDCKLSGDVVRVEYGYFGNSVPEALRAAVTLNRFLDTRTDFSDEYQLIHECAKLVSNLHRFDIR